MQKKAYMLFYTYVIFKRLLIRLLDFFVFDICNYFSKYSISVALFLFISGYLGK